ncbi:MAG: Ig domain-containing protein [Spirochaetaceae bacterium]|nr:Ig domain-containing protein [Spirochaetaceae bacterium]
MSLTTGESVTLVMTIEPDNATNKAVTWTSDDDSVASVEQDGKVTAQGPGDTIIRVKTADGDFEATCSVKVTEPVGVEDISLNRASLTIRITGTETLVATITPDDATNKDVIWRSDNDGVASVEQDGTVTAVANGTTTITVTTVDGDYEATCTITVKTPEDLDTLGQYTELDATTDGTAGPSGTYVTFGTWPQTIKASDVTVDEIDANKFVVGMFTYYMGSDGAWYNKQRENAYKNSEQYKYTDGTQVQMFNANSYRWFKVMPIKWRVLNASNSKAESSPKFLLAESGIMADALYFDNENERTIDSKTIYPNNYEHSKIRAWLNGIGYDNGSANSEHENKGFFQTAFTTSQQAVIKETEVDNTAASTASSPNNRTCNKTNDKIFLLSYSEVNNNSYFVDNDVRIRKPTDFALAKNSVCSSDTKAVNFFLRSPRHDSSSVLYVNSAGRTKNTISCYVDYNMYGIVPALYYQP